MLLHSPARRQAWSERGVLHQPGICGYVKQQRWTRTSRDRTTGSADATNAQSATALATAANCHTHDTQCLLSAKGARLHVLPVQGVRPFECLPQPTVSTVHRVCPWPTEGCEPRSIGCMRKRSRFKSQWRHMRHHRLVAAIPAVHFALSTALRCECVDANRQGGVY